MFDLWLVETPTGALHIENPLVWLVLSSFILLIIFIFLHSYLHGWFNCYYLLNFVVVWFQKISIPPTRREFEISEGWRGVNENQEIPEGKGGETVELVFRCPSIHSPFRLEVDKTSSSKQPRSKEIKTLVIFRTLFAYVSPESIRTHGCSRINILFSIILNSLLRMIPQVFYEPYSSRSAGYVWLCSFLKRNSSFLRRCCLFWKRKQHIDIWSDQVSCRVNNKSFLKRSKRFSRFKFFKSKQCENKLSSKKRNPSL